MKFIRGFVTFVLLFFFVNYSFSIRINEVMQSNVNGIMDDLNEFPDSWVELYNDDSIPVNLQGYRISVKNKFDSAYVLSDSVRIDINGYYLVYCDKEGKGRHTDFRLNSDEDGYLYLFNEDGVISDSLFIPEMPAPNISYGKVLDDESRWSYYKNATPMKANEGAYSDYVLSNPKFSVKGGVFDTPLYLKISVNKKDAGIPNLFVRYTTNGSEPTDSSALFPDSLYIDSTVVIRAKVFSDSLVSKPSVTQSYLFFDRDITLPIISVAIDSSYLYDDEIGIYVKGTYGENHPDVKNPLPSLGNCNYCFNWKRPVNFEYFLPNKEQSEINQICEVRIGGNTSRTSKVKSLVFNANKRFGTKRFSHDFWPWKLGEKGSKSFYLRNGGGDGGRTRIRDAFAQTSFGKYVDLDWLAYQPAIFMINGQYQGILNIRERAHEDYVWKNHGKIDNIDLIDQVYGAVKYGDGKDYKEFKNVSASLESTYEQICEYMDVSEFLNYFILNTLFSNNDFPGNNYRLWKEKKTGAKWRWFAYDMDQSSGLQIDKEIYNYDFRYLNYILRKEPFLDNGYSNREAACVLFQKMMTFSEFSEQYIERMSVYLGTFATGEKLVHLIDSLTCDVEYEIPYHCEATNRSESSYNSNVKRLKEWVSLRVPFVYQDMKEFFSLGDTVSLRIKSDFENLMEFNGVKVVDNIFAGCYYKNRAIQLFQEVPGKKNMWIVSYVNKDSDSTQTLTFVQKDTISFVIPEEASEVTVENIPYELDEESDSYTTSLNPTISDFCCPEYAGPYSLFSVDGRVISDAFVESSWNLMPPGIYIIVSRNKEFKFAKRIIKN